MRKTCIEVPYMVTGKARIPEPMIVAIHVSVVTGRTRHSLNSEEEVGLSSVETCIVEKGVVSSEVEVFRAEGN